MDQLSEKYAAYWELSKKWAELDQEDRSVLKPYFIKLQTEWKNDFLQNKKVELSLLMQELSRMQKSLPEKKDNKDGVE